MSTALTLCMASFNYNVTIIQMYFNTENKERSICISTVCTPGPFKQLTLIIIIIIIIIIIQHLYSASVLRGMQRRLTFYNTACHSSTQNYHTIPAVVTEQEPVEPLKLIFSQSVFVLINWTFFHCLPLLHTWSAFTLHKFHITHRLRLKA